MYRDVWVWTCTEMYGYGHVQRCVGMDMYRDVWVRTCTEMYGYGHVQRCMGMDMYRDVWVRTCAEMYGYGHVQRCMHYKSTLPFHLACVCQSVYFVVVSQHFFWWSSLSACILSDSSANKCLWPNKLLWNFISFIWYPSVPYFMVRLMAVVVILMYDFLIGTSR